MMLRTYLPPFVGSQPEAGDFFLMPTTGTVGLVVERSAEAIGVNFHPSVIANDLQLVWLEGRTTPLRPTSDAMLVRRNRVTKGARYFLKAVMLELGPLFPGLPDLVDAIDLWYSG